MITVNTIEEFEAAADNGQTVKVNDEFSIQAIWHYAEKAQTNYDTALQVMEANQEHVGTDEEPWLFSVDAAEFIDRMTELQQAIERGGCHLCGAEVSQRRHFNGVKSIQCTGCGPR